MARAEANQAAMGGDAAPAVRFAPLAWRRGSVTPGARELPEETPVALSYDRVGFAVMMGSPADLEDFAVGFSFCEGIIASAAEIVELEIVTVAEGIECRMSLTPARREALDSRRRRIAGPLGCGLCGLDSLRQVARLGPPVQAGGQVTANAIAEGMARMARLQVLNRRTRAAHAAAWATPDGELILREDVGRHNALDKVIGAVLRRGDAGDARDRDGVLLMTSRVSLDLIQKAAAFGAPVLAAISVPTARAVRAAEAAGITLIAVARDDGFEVFTHPERILFDEG